MKIISINEQYYIDKSKLDSKDRAQIELINQFMKEDNYEDYFKK